MLAMQYSIRLSADQDAEAVRRRVSERSALFDQHKGLIHKSFIYCQDDHLYAPFYLWRESGEARNFLLDDLFKGVVDAFNRHRIRSWIVLDMAYGNRTLKPAFALREIDPVPVRDVLSELQQREKARQLELLENENLYLHVTALDADRWELMRYSLWKDKELAAKPESDVHQGYEVLHVSEPG